MNGKKAKAIRRAVYGDMSLHVPRRYVMDIRKTIWNDPRGLRARYQAAKREAGVR